MKVVRLLILMPVLWITGCASPVANFGGHAILPGYSVAKYLTDKSEQVERVQVLRYEHSLAVNNLRLEAEILRLEGGDPTPFLSDAEFGGIGVDVFALGDAVREDKWGLILSSLWDVAKVGLLAAGNSWYQDQKSEKRHAGDRDSTAGAKITQGPGSTADIEGNCNDIDSEQGAESHLKCRQAEQEGSSTK